MEVILGKDFFAPNGSLYKSKGPSTSVDIPDEFRNKLPSDAKIVKQKIEAPVEKEEVKIPVPIEVAQADAVAAVEKQAEVARRKTVRRKKVD